MVITGLFEHLIDDKNRLAIPSEIRSAMEPEIDGTAFYLVPEFRYLQLVPEKLFRECAMRNPTGLFRSSPTADAIRYLFANSPKLELDKQGRLIIPERFMASSRNPMMERFPRLEREVTLVGAGSFVEIWNTSIFVAHMRELTSNPVVLSTNLQNLFGTPPTAASPGAATPMTA